MNNVTAWINRHRSLASALGAAVLAIILVFVAALPLYRSSSALLSKLATKTKELDALTGKVSILSKLDKSVLQERVTTIDTALPPKKDVLTYLVAIDGLSRDLGLTYGGFSLSPGELGEATASAGTVKKTSKAGGLQSLDTEIKMRGGQESVYTFLKTIESVLPLMQIKNVGVSVIGEDQYSLNLTLGMLWAEPSAGEVSGSVTLFGPEEEKYFTQLSAYKHFDPIVGDVPLVGGKTDLFSQPTLPQ